MIGTRCFKFPTQALNLVFEEDRIFQTYSPSIFVICSWALGHQGRQVRRPKWRPHHGHGAADAFYFARTSQDYGLASLTVVALVH